MYSVKKTKSLVWPHARSVVRKIIYTGDVKGQKLSSHPFGTEVGILGLLLTRVRPVQVQPWHFSQYILQGSGKIDWATSWLMDIYYSDPIYFMPSSLHSPPPPRKRKTTQNSRFLGTKIEANSRNSVPKHFADENTLSILFAGTGFFCKTNFFHLIPFLSVLRNWLFRKPFRNYSAEFFWNEIPLATPVAGVGSPKTIL